MGCAPSVRAANNQNQAITVKVQAHKETSQVRNCSPPITSTTTTTLTRTNLQVTHTSGEVVPEQFSFIRFSPLLSELSMDKEISENGQKRKNGKEIEKNENIRQKKIMNYCISTLLGHPKPIKLCVLSPDETKLASACVRESLIVMWDLITLKTIFMLDGHDDGVLCCAFSPDGRFLVSGSIDNTLIVWDASTGKMLHKLFGHQYIVCTCGFSRDGSLIVSGSGDNSLIIWSSKSGLPLGTLEGHTKIVSSCSFSPDGNSILSGSADRTLIIWSTKTGERQRQLRAHFDVILCCCYSFDGRRIVSNDKRTLKVWDSSNGCQLFSMPISPSSLSPPSDSLQKSYNGNERKYNLCAFSPDGSNIITCSNDRTVTFWDPSTGKEVLCFYFRQAAIALCAGPYHVIAFGDEAGNIYLVRLATQPRKTPSITKQAK